MVTIGDRTVIGMRSGIVCHESITIGDDVWFGQEIYVTDANHGYTDPDTPPGKQLGSTRRWSSATVAGSVTARWCSPAPTSARNVVVAAGSVVGRPSPTGRSSVACRPR
jgi:hypothetical protein